MDATLIICLAQLTAVAGREGAKSYLKHRKKMIHEGRGDELVSHRIKKISDDIRMSSPLKRPSLKRDRRISFTKNVLNTVIDTVQPKSEIIDQLQEDLIPPLAEKLDDLFLKSKPVLEGRMSSILRSLTPTRMRSETKDVAVGSEDFRKFIADLLLFVQCEYELQREVPNSLLLKQKDFHIKLVRHLDEVAKKKRETDA